MRNVSTIIIVDANQSSYFSDW